MYKWYFKGLDPDNPMDSSFVMDNFIRESKSPESILIRELLQNTLDARVESSEEGKVKAHVSIREIQPRIDDNRSILEELTTYVQISSGNPLDIDFDSPKALVVEEYFTSGLTGNTINPRAKGEKERWANFWHCEGVRTKTGKSLGRAGQGKITFFMSSKLNCLLAISKRIYDNQVYAYGKCILDECPEVNGKYYQRHHLWGNKTDEHATVKPITDEASIAKLKDVYCLERENETGTSFIIPFPVDGLEKEKLIKAVLQDFYYPIFRNHLTVSVENIEITSANLEELINRYLLDDSQPSIQYLRFLKNIASLNRENISEVKGGWNAYNSLKEEAFSESIFSDIKNDFNESKTIAVRFPIVISSKEQGVLNSYIDVFLYNEDTIKKTEELFIRSDLVIGDEKKLKNVAKNCFGLVLIEDSAVSEFLGYAEEASHMRWNAKEREVEKRYRNVPATLNSIRQAMPRLYRLLRGYDSGSYENLFDDILSIPSTLSTTKKKRKKKKQKGPGEATPTGDVDEHKKKEPLFELYDLQNAHGVGIRSIDDKIKENMLPLTGTLEVAYDRLEGDGEPFKSWHPFDFDFLINKRDFKIDKDGIRIRKRDENIISFDVNNVNFFLEVSGFNKAQFIKSKGTLKDA